MENPASFRGRLAVCTDGMSPRKHSIARCDNPGKSFRVVLGNGIEDRMVEVSWFDADTKTGASVGIDVSTLRAMLAEAESYRPGATLSSPRAAVSV